MTIDLGLPPILFQGRASTNQTISSASTITRVALDIEDADDASAHSSATPGRFIVPRAGAYRLSGGATWQTGQSTTNPIRYIAFAKNGAVVLGGQMWGTYSGNYLTQTPPSMDLFGLVVGDYLELVAVTTFAGAIIASAVPPVFRVEWLR